MDTRTITVVLYPEAQSKHYDLVESLGRSNGLEVSERHEGKRVVKLTGPVDKLINLFTQKLPDELHKAVAAILGFNENPVAKTKIRPAKSDNPSPMTPIQVAQHYDFPSDVDGSGQTIAIIELGGGYQATDLIAYWNKLGIKNPPVVSSIAVDGVGNSPSGDPDGPDGEVMLDIEVSGAVAPGAHIAVYFAPNTDQGFLDAINTAIHDGQNKPSVVSISWGGPENGWADQAKTAMNLAFQDAAKLGITVLVAAGDNGSSDGGEGVNVDFPSSSPFVTSCGGTRLIGDGDKILEEVAWNDGSEGGATGGGVSVFFPVPEWQKGKTDKVKKGSKLLTGRGVPDVAGNADPESGYEVIVDGQSQVIGGTSAVAPLYAGLVALLNQKLGKSLGYLNPTLYVAPSSVFHDITCGDNGNYICTSGWDSVTGLGSINGKAAEFFLK